MRLMLAALVVLVMGGAIAGAGMGDAPAEREAAPAQAEVQAAGQRIAAGGRMQLRVQQVLQKQGYRGMPHNTRAPGGGRARGFISTAITQ